MNAQHPGIVRLLKALSLFLLGSCTMGHAQELNSRITSVFLFNFAKQVQWPPHSPAGDFVIGIMGDSELLNELKANATQIKINGRLVIIKALGRNAQPNEWKTCHMVFVRKPDAKAMLEVSDALGDAPVLVVGEGEGQKGSTINLFLNKEESRPKFEMSKATLEKHGLKATSMLTNLAVAM